MHIGNSIWEVTNRSRVITLIGAYGKTTSLLRLGQEITRAGQKVVLTTSTKVFSDLSTATWSSKSDPPPSHFKHPCFWYASEDARSGKWLGPNKKYIDMAIDKDWANEENRYWIIEGDGAKGSHLKCWAEHEPQIPSKTECAILILDADLLGKTLEFSLVHRPELCYDLIGKEWTQQTIWTYVKNSPVFYRVYDNVRWVVLFNTKGDPSSSYLSRILDVIKQSSEQTDAKGHSSRPLYLRMAIGNVKKGGFIWTDL